MREISLSAIRADGWFERVGRGSASFHQLVSLVGERTFAYSLIVGVHIVSVVLDRRNLDGSQVSFTVGDQVEPTALPLSEFKRRVTLAVLEETVVRPPQPLDDAPESVEAFLGARFILLAAYEHIALDALIVDETKSMCWVRFENAGRSQKVTLLALENALIDRVREDATALSSERASIIDASAVIEAAERAGKGDFAGVVSILGRYVGPLSMRARTSEVQRMSAEARARVARALALLGHAYVRTYEFEQADAVLRLGIQWTRDGQGAAEIFFELGNSALVRGAEGAAIAPLRRALALGHPRTLVLPKLAEAFARRRKFVPAMICLDEAAALGVDTDEFALLRGWVAEQVGEAWARFRTHVPLADDSRDTLRPPDFSETDL